MYYNEFKKYIVLIVIKARTGSNGPFVRIIKRLAANKFKLIEGVCLLMLR